MPKQVLIGITVKKSEDFPEWYHQILTKCELISFHDVSGCYVLRPKSYFIWEQIQHYINQSHRQHGVQNSYFPLFISPEMLEKEKEHLDDFTPEVAWVTRAGTKDLTKPLAIRPTSETSMYPYYKDWISSYRDLPLKLNQWNNVVRWEFKNPTPFIRSREFLWQEGHSAHATMNEAIQQVKTNLELYQQIYRHVLAIETVPGYKTEKEKFAGAEHTMTLEAFIPEVNRGIQACTSHYLGQNFSKMFDIVFEDENGQKNNVHQTSWGFTTRSIGVLLMTHGDDKGIILPPFVAFQQVIIVPTGINKKMSADDLTKLLEYCRSLSKNINRIGFRCHLDDRMEHSPPYKYNYWEMRGVPLRLEIGLRELKDNKTTFVNRVTGEKTPEEMPTDDKQLFELMSRYLYQIHETLYQQSKQKIKGNIKIGTSIVDIQTNIDNKQLTLIPFCGQVECEKKFLRTVSHFDEQYLGVKTLCFPSKQKTIPETKCFNCDTMVTRRVLMGKSY